VDKLLIIRFGSIGDIIFTTYAIQQLKIINPNSQIYYLTLDHNKQILDNIPQIYKLIS